MSNNSIRVPTAIVSIKSFLLFSILFYLPIYFSGIGFSGFEIGILLSVFSVTALASSFLAGLFSDRFPVRYLSAFSFFLLVAFAGCLGLTDNFWIILISFFIGGLGNNIADISLTSFVLKVTERKDSGTQLGVFDAIKTLASGLGALTGGVLIAYLSFEKVFTVIAVLFCVTILFTFSVRKVETVKYAIEHYKGDLWKKEILYFILLIFVFTLHWGAEGTSYTLLLKEYFGLGQNVIALYVGSVWIFYAFFIYRVSRKITEATPIQKVIYPALILSGLGDILFLYPFLPVSYVFRLVHELGDAGFEMFLLVGIHRYFPSERIGGTSGVVLTVTIAGRLMGALVFGPLGDVFGYHYPFILSGILTLLCMGIAGRCKW